MTAADIETRALALSKRQEQAVLAADALQEIAEDEGVPKYLREEAGVLFRRTVAVARSLSAEHERVRAVGASCQDVAAFGPTRPPPPPPPPGAVAEPPCVVCGGSGTVASDEPFMMMAAVPCGACEGRGRR